MFDIFKNCLMGLVGLSLMAYAEWLSFDKEQRKREFFEHQERMEDLQDRLQERFDRARASRTPINFEDLWRTVEERQRKRKREAATTATPSTASETQPPGDR